MSTGKVEIYSRPQPSSPQLALAAWQSRKNLYFELEEALNIIKSKVVSRFPNPTEERIQEIMDIAWNTASFALQGKTKEQIQELWGIGYQNTTLFMDDETLDLYVRVFKVVAENFLVRTNHLGELIKMASKIALFGDLPEVSEPAAYLWGDEDELHHELISIEHSSHYHRWPEVFSGKYSHMFAPTEDQDLLPGN
ncbi:hypothetical protein [Moorena sp. SIO3A5]|uniref:hypothetical protein n=1 Tax=Moorena sp. SIO3A5 TaxID=2607822 RepID=UPI00257BF362|nr:hypothetical protein [Moorena sp. SIO3A5]